MVASGRHYSSEIGQPQKENYYIISFTRISTTVILIKAENRMVIARV